MYMYPVCELFHWRNAWSVDSGAGILDNGEEKPATIGPSSPRESEGGESGQTVQGQGGGTVQADSGQEV